MPPRKSNVSAVSATGDEGTPVKEKERDGINVEDLALPRTMVQRLAKGVLPSNTRIDKDAIAAMSKSATVFVNYLSNGANDRTQTTNRKTISPENVLEALADLELASFLPRVEAELRRFNEIQTGKRNEYRRKLKEGKDGSDGPTGSGKGRKSGGGEGGSNGLEDDEVGGGGEGEERAAKRVRREEGDGNGNGEEGGPEGQLRANGEAGREEGNTGFDAIEAVDAAIRAEEEEEEDEGDQGEADEDIEGEDEDEDDEDDSHDEDSDTERWNPDPMAEKMEIADANLEGMSSRREQNITDDSDEDDTD